MVGVGAEGKESSLARVSIVNFYGALQMDEFVRQKERVVDYRTEFSGIRPSDMVKGTRTTSHRLNDIILTIGTQQSPLRRYRNKSPILSRIGSLSVTLYITI